MAMRASQVRIERPARRAATVARRSGPWRPTDRRRWPSQGATDPCAHSQAPPGQTIRLIAWRIQPWVYLPSLDNSRGFDTDDVGSPGAVPVPNWERERASVQVPSPDIHQMNVVTLARD